MDVVSGSAQVLKGGVLQYTPSCHLDLCLRNPRTVAGVTATGQVILMVVDGPFVGLSIGATLYELGHGDEGVWAPSMPSTSTGRLGDDVDQGARRREPPHRLLAASGLCRTRS